MKFNAIVENNPQRKPLPLTVGQSAVASNPTASVTEINSAFLNVGRVGYYRLLHLKALNIKPNDDTSILLRQIQRDFGADIIASVSIGLLDTHVSVQTPFMRGCLEDRSEAGRLISGIQTDVTYKYFKTGYLLSSSVYNKRVQRWVPVLFSWIEGLSAAHHQPHFRIIMEMLRDSEEITDGEETDNLLSHVMDFSAAQRVAFQTSYADIFTNEDRDWDAAYLHASSLCKGCAEHFRASVTRLKRNGAVVDSSSQSVFESMVLRWLSEDLTIERYLCYFNCMKLSSRSPECFRSVS